MKTFFTTVFWVILLLPAAYLAIAWVHIPQTVPLHFDLHGNVDNYGSKNVLIGLTALNIAVYLLLTNIHRIDPKRFAGENRLRLKPLAISVGIFLSFLLLIIIYAALHALVSVMPKLLYVMIGIFFSFIGNYMYNIKPNYFAGIRTPWALESEDNWRKTHHLAGTLWFAGGILLAIVSLILDKASAPLFIGTIVILAIVPIIYSYNLFLQQKKAK